MSSGLQCDPIDQESHDLFINDPVTDKEFSRHLKIDVIEERVSEEDDYTSFKKSKSKRNYNSQMSP
jgi:hypothetical protein